MTMLAVSGGVGGASSLLRWSFKGEWVSARRDLFPAQTNLEGRLGWSGQLTERHRTRLVVHGATARHVRFPLQHTLRDDIDGLLGYRTTNLGGGSRVVAAFEERHRLPIPGQLLEVAVSALAQTGRLWAGDTPYGTTTPWYQAVGGAVMISYPAGARQALRIEYGRPLNAPAGLQRYELRVVYTDVTGRF
jgi:hemolysin activation/secretion protein